MLYVTRVNKGRWQIGLYNQPWAIGMFNDAEEAVGCSVDSLLANGAELPSPVSVEVVDAMGVGRVYSVAHNGDESGVTEHTSDMTDKDIAKVDDVFDALCVDNHRYRAAWGEAQEQRRERDYTNQKLKELEAQ